MFHNRFSLLRLALDFILQSISTPRLMLTAHSHENEISVCLHIVLLFTTYYVKTVKIKIISEFQLISAINPRQKHEWVVSYNKWINFTNSFTNTKLCTSEKKPDAMQYAALHKIKPCFSCQLFLSGIKLNRLEVRSLALALVSVSVAVFVCKQCDA